ncbi:acetaldehyde dehydrogenase [Rhodococcus wratislaviensis IFP 2016]|nr:acetaldehyde dehydrogenase [Rhodococcus wratislaviensis IFP 2016]
MVGIDPGSDGLARATRLGVPTTAAGVDGLIGMPGFEDIDIVFDAPSAVAHIAHAEKTRRVREELVDLTPAAIGPYVVPAVNLARESRCRQRQHGHLRRGGNDSDRGGNRPANPLRSAEIVASIASKSAGPGTRAHIDEFTETTARAIEEVGGTERGKAIIVLNPAEPEMIMRDTVLCLTDRLGADTQQRIRASVERMARNVARYVPGYRLEQAVQFTEITADEPVHTLAAGVQATESATS